MADKGTVRCISCDQSSNVAFFVCLSLSHSASDACLSVFFSFVFLIFWLGAATKRERGKKDRNKKQWQPHESRSQRSTTDSKQAESKQANNHLKQLIYAAKASIGNGRPYVRECNHLENFTDTQDTIHDTHDTHASIMLVNTLVITNNHKPPLTKLLLTKTIFHLPNNNQPPAYP